MASHLDLIPHIPTGLGSGITHSLPLSHSLPLPPHPFSFFLRSYNFRLKVDDVTPYIPIHRVSKRRLRSQINGHIVFLSLSLLLFSSLLLLLLLLSLLLLLLLLSFGSLFLTHSLHPHNRCECVCVEYIRCLSERERGREREGRRGGGGRERGGGICTALRRYAFVCFSIFDSFFCELSSLSLSLSHTHTHHSSSLLFLSPFLYINIYIYISLLSTHLIPLALLPPSTFLPSFSNPPSFCPSLRFLPLSHLLSSLLSFSFSLLSPLIFSLKLLSILFQRKRSRLSEYDRLLWTLTTQLMSTSLSLFLSFTLSHAHTLSLFISRSISLSLPSLSPSLSFTRTCVHTLFLLLISILSFSLSSAPWSEGCSVEFVWYVCQHHRRKLSPGVSSLSPSPSHFLSSFLFLPFSHSFSSSLFLSSIPTLSLPLSLSLSLFSSHPLFLSFPHSFPSFLSLSFPLYPIHLLSSLPHFLLSFLSFQILWVWDTSSLSLHSALVLSKRIRQVIELPFHLPTPLLSHTNTQSQTYTHLHTHWILTDIHAYAFTHTHTHIHLKTYQTHNHICKLFPPKLTFTPFLLVTPYAGDVASLSPSPTPCLFLLLHLSLG